jgi:hypothetical protein
MNTTLKSSSIETKPTHQQIAVVAYQLWERGGHQSNRDQEYWLQAEKQLATNSQAASSKTVSAEPVQKPPPDTRNKALQCESNDRPRREFSRP